MPALLIQDRVNNFLVVSAAFVLAGFCSCSRLCDKYYPLQSCLSLDVVCAFFTENDDNAKHNATLITAYSLF